MTETVHTADAETVKIDVLIRDYRPKDLAASTWEVVRQDAGTLVRAAGPLRFDRVRMDLQALGALVTYACSQHHDLALRSLLTDAMLLEFDQAVLAQRRSGTRENLRGRLRRLQATLNGVPAGAPRRRPEARLKAIAPFDLLARVGVLNHAAQNDPSPAAAAWRACWAALTSGGRLAWPDDLPDAVWNQARRYAAEACVPLTKTQVRAGALHVALTTETAVAAVVPALGLTRRDLDLALVHPAASGALSGAELQLLRGL